MNMEARQDSAADRRKPYEAPRILSEDILETTALACGKKPNQGGRCMTRSKAS
jgi:hypothetical protein